MRDESRLTREEFGDAIAKGLGRAMLHVRRHGLGEMADLVLDACLPEEIGFETISIIKGLCHHLPIIVTAEENNPELESRIRQQGIFYYHVKSFGPDELMLAISNAMERSSQ